MTREFEHNGRKIVLLGTAHISESSVKEVENEIESRKPDCVAVELDSGRLQSLKDPESWKKMDIVKVLKEKKGFLMMANFVLAGFQKRMGTNVGVKPGEEMKAAIEKAESLGIKCEMVDRPIQTTLRRAWAKSGFMGKMKLLAALVSSAFSKEEVSNGDVENLKEKNEMDSMMAELSDYMPVVKEVLIDERDFYLASHIWNCSGNNVLAVLGAGHLNGVEKCLEKFAAGESSDSSSISEVPSKNIASKILGWAIPVAIVGLIAAGFYFGGREKGSDLLGSWVIWNGLLSGIGAIVAGAHPLAILVSIVGAPITSLCPLIGVGFVSGIVQAWVRKPKISDMESLQDDVSSVKGFYKNRILRVLLVFFFSSIGSSIGTFVAGASFVAIFSSFFDKILAFFK